MITAFRNIETKLVHCGEHLVEGAVCLPVFQSVTFASRPEDGYHDVRYIRLSNTPNHRLLDEKLAAIEGGEAALVTASGMAAISTSLLTFLRAGDHLLVQNCLYGGTHGFVTQELPALGVSYDFMDGNDADSWERLLRPTTRAIYVESMTNPMLDVADLPAVVRFARAHRARRPERWRRVVRRRARGLRCRERPRAHSRTGASSNSTRVPCSGFPRFPTTAGWWARSRTCRFTSWAQRSMRSEERR